MCSVRANVVFTEDTSIRFATPACFLFVCKRIWVTQVFCNALLQLLLLLGVVLAAFNSLDESYALMIIVLKSACYSSVFVTKLTKFPAVCFAH